MSIVDRLRLRVILVFRVVCACANDCSKRIREVDEGDDYDDD